ncbi:MAG: c-type cytochrome [Mesorhizobium sp.]|uniref:c-type cytochrome n=1 Tax=Mesorhizobium sp. TaxID=1871066 RepID=UPI000FE5CF00|nr:c-type cytochrome [Mesorhizobium sp.]RWM21449.1 MAG: c-type cytochrome [Mesorhizobium sp.]TIP71769.1 MAG: c-type cytochrome [Mesorhizobium sp.]TIQ14591.1 MAG: c-type cytochrome [Mesorhizobium sp.]TIR52264.1 MAG: c-type cytochrome [Mesorhizobium sp.]TJV97149.1 MAG: c-type cytochrome [Mesorhizobium sp.]
MSHSQATTRSHVISAGDTIASLATSITRVRASLAAFLTAAGLLLPVAASAQQADGERLFRQRCGACHSLEPGQNRAGPHLSGVIGRKAGSVEGARYSAALRESDIVWDGGTLDTFLAAPRQRVPGTSMTVGVPNAAQRAAIIGYLEGAVAQ